MGYVVSSYIDGLSVNSAPLKTCDIHNPAWGDVIGHVNFASHSTCDAAIAAGLRAWPNWASTPPHKRAQVLFKFRELLERYQLDLASMVTREHGKTIADAKGSIARAIELIEFHCGLLTQLQGSFSANVATSVDCYTQRQSLGLCAGISPFNFPVMVPIWMLIPAIACGNSFILKPSEQTPSAPVRLLELLNDAGLPPGVANCIHGDKTIVEYLICHRDVAAVTAVASSPVAESIYLNAVACAKRAHTFGSAKNHGVIMPDADLEHAACAILGAAFGSAGERCMALSVIVAVGATTAEAIVAKLLPKIAAIKVDAGDAPLSDMGPLISSAHKKRVLAAIDHGLSDGAKLLVDGRNFKHPQYPRGYFIGPCLFDNVNEEMSIYKDEIFGPVLLIMRVDNFEQALALVNRCPYANGSVIFTSSGFSACAYAQGVEAGMVGINVPIPVPIANHPFGGWKSSSFGDIGMHGAESIHFYTKLKTVTAKWPALQENVSTFSMPNHS